MSKYNKTENPFIFSNGTQFTERIRYGDTVLKYDITFNRFPWAEKKNVLIELFFNATFKLTKDSIFKLNENINSMSRSQIISRVIHGADSYYIEANNAYVMYYSIGQSIVIILSGMGQVYFIKRLFTTTTPQTKH